MNNKIVLLASVSILFIAGACCCAEEQTIFQDNFDNYNSSNWGPMPGQGISISDGKLVNSPPQGQTFIVSNKKFKACSIQMRVKFNRLSTDSSIFYYIGFQSVTPWTHNLCWLSVQDGQLSIGLKKDGLQGLSENIASLNADKWYNIKITRQEGSVEVFIDDKSVFKTDKADVIPTAAIPIFLGANTLSGNPLTGQKSALPAEFQIDSITVLGDGSEGATTAAARKISVSAAPQQLGSSDSVFASVDNQKIHLENIHYICDLSIGSGLKWSRLFSKPAEEEYLAEEGNSAIFKIIGRNFSFNSNEFDVNDVKLSQEANSISVDVLLSHPEYKFQCVLNIQISSSDQMLWKLKLKNTSSRLLRARVVFPIIASINIADSINENSYFFPWRSGIVGKVDCDLLYEYGGLAWMQVISVFNPSLQAGIYTYPKDDTGTFKGMIFKKKSGGSEMVKHSELIAPYEMPAEDVFELNKGLGLAYYYLEQRVEPASEYSTPQTVVSIYRGAWKQPLKSYSQWAHTWYKHVNTPQWFMDCFSFLPQHKPAYYDSEKKKYVAADRLAGSEHVVQWAHWWDYQEKQDWPSDILMGREQPGDFDYNVERGGIEAFKSEIKKMQDKGTRFTVYIDHRFCCKDTKIGKEKGQQWAAIYKPGGEVEGYGSPNDQYVTCFQEPNAWPKFLAETCGRIVRDTGMDGIYLDELALSFACYNPEHIHNRLYKSPMYLPAFVKNITDSRDAMIKQNPQAILMTEHAGSDYFSQFIDGSWSQTYFHTGFPFAEKFFDESSLNYFHFCFPEFKLAEWGDAKDGPHRCFFNGIGIDWGAGSIDYLRQTGQVLKENGEVFASTDIEPLVETRAKNILVNRFKGKEKTLYTVYNKSGSAFDGELLDVDPKSGTHWVELLNDNPLVVRMELVKSTEVVALNIAAGEVLCMARLPVVITAGLDKGVITVSLAGSDKCKLYAFMDKDTSQMLVNDGKLIEVKDNKAQINLAETFGRSGKVILKLVNDNGKLVDEVILNVGK